MIDRTLSPMSGRMSSNKSKGSSKMVNFNTDIDVQSITYVDSKPTVPAPQNPSKQIFKDTFPTSERKGNNSSLKLP